MGALVDLVEVGAFLAVDLDVDEQAVHCRRGRRVLEGLVRHHVAPVARGITDRQQDRLVLGPCLREGRLAPRQPRDRIGGVLEEVGRGLGRETVGGFHVESPAGDSTIPD